MSSEFIRPTPWDTAVFDIPCFEIDKPDEPALALAAATPGHYTVRIEPLADKELLHRYGFYYADTLIEPSCTPERFIARPHPEAGIDPSPRLEDLLPLCDDSFVYGRFHRDFNLHPAQADQRYKQWLSQIHQKGGVLGLTFKGELAGFIAHEEGDLLLHAVAEQFRGRGLAKHLWTAAIEQLFRQGITDIFSSVSAANLAVLNLYASLGFRFSQVEDIYHRLTR